MCGIIGYTGGGDAVPKITEGLSVLEYRGYDSVGIAAAEAEGISVVKCRGRIDALRQKLDEIPTEECHCAIGHTRWATHGGPSDTNAHPHRAGRVVLVHNGIIENYRQLKDELTADGVSFVSETDTEVAAALLNRYYEAEGDPIRAIRKTVERLTGSYAFGILFDGIPDRVFAVRKGSPLILAKGEDGYYLASDLTALLPFTRQYYCLEEGEIAELSPDRVLLTGEKGSQTEPREWKTTDMTPESAQKGGFPHFMLKEIFEQPDAIIHAVSPRIRDGLPDFSADGIRADFWNKVKNVQIVACGSAMHAGIAGAGRLEKLAGVPASVFIASEYRYHPPVAVEGTLVIVISQSGETADTLAALRYAKSAGLPTLAIVNAVETTIAREAERRIYTYAGPEIAVATTKGYCTQAAVLCLIAVAMAYARGKINSQTARRLTEDLSRRAPEAVFKVLTMREKFRAIAEAISRKEHIFYIGRGMDYALSLEAALKLKEISYIHCEAYAAGELKHGTISLVEEGTPVIAISTDRDLEEKMESNIREVRSRGAFVVSLCREDAERAETSADVTVRLPSDSDTESLFAALTAIQLIAYETASCRGCDIDRPRNLAKSVTVE